MNEPKFIFSLAPTLKRLIDLFVHNRQMSITRSLQYECLSKIVFKGDLLDIGGGDKADYKEKLNCQNYHSVNIDKTIAPTWAIKNNKDIEQIEQKFDCILSMNTFEHVLDAEELLRSASKLLKKMEIFASTPSSFQFTEVRMTSSDQRPVGGNKCC